MFGYIGGASVVSAADEGEGEGLPSPPPSMSASGAPLTTDGYIVSGKPKMAYDTLGSIESDEAVGEDEEKVRYGDPAVTAGAGDVLKTTSGAITDAGGAVAKAGDDTEELY